MQLTAPTYAVIDVETPMNSPIGNPGTPFHPLNKFVLRGLKRGDHVVSISEPRGAGLGVLGSDPKVRAEIKLLVGHHIGFDIHHMRMAKEIDETFLGTVELWDTQLAEYLISGQRTTYAALDDLSLKYGGTAKDSRVTTMFKAGMGADKIPLADLEPYLKDDILNTERVFFGQWKTVTDMGLMPLVRTQMDALAATIEMTFNGMKVDYAALLKGATALRTHVDSIEFAIKADACTRGYPDFNVGSTKQLSTLLFGGERKYKEKEQIGLTKEGKPKVRLVEKVQVYEGMFKPTAAKNGKGDYPTDDATLKSLRAAVYGASKSAETLDNIIEFRDKDKQLGTYWEGLLKLVMPDGCIHHSLNHCNTKTGRLASSDPNMQNMTNGEIKAVFVSRFGDDGVLVEADFKQLEMVELACLSADKQLLADILSGVDMHDALFEAMYGRKMTKEERKHFKRCSFCLVYGGGAKAIAEQGGIPEADAKIFIDTFYARYRGVKEYHDSVVQWAKDHRTYTGLKDAKTGYPVGECVWTALATGRRYWFREYPTDWGTINFSPSELKNYMVQGGATGDKVPLCLGKLFRILKNDPTLKDLCLMVNTVHDSVLFDVHKDVLHTALTTIKDTMERTPEFYEEAFGYKMPLPLKVELSCGPNWLDQHEVKFDSMGVPDSGTVWRKAA